MTTAITCGAEITPLFILGTITLSGCKRHKISRSSQIPFEKDFPLEYFLRSDEIIFERINMERQRFLILDYPIPGDQVSKLLGRLTLDFKHPMDASEPADPSAITRPFLQPPIREKAARIFASAAHDHNLRIALEPFIDLPNGPTPGTETSLATALIETHRLRDHNKVFTRLIDKYPKEISDMMSYENARFGHVPDKLYMVIGYKCILDSHATEKVVFAVEYKMYSKSRLQLLFRRKKLPWGYVKNRTLDFAAGQAPGEDDEDSMGSDDHSDLEESEEEEMMDEELTEGGYICRLGLDEFYVPHRE